MVKSVLGSNHQALQEWLAQRVTAVVMAVYALGLMGFFLAHPNIAYYEWHGLFSQVWMKVATALVVLSMLYHAWIGMWTVFTDYIKCYSVRMVLEILVVLAFFAVFLQTLFILWGV